MNSVMDNKYVEEMMCGANFSYILNDNCTFSSTEYKVLQSQTNGCFVKCMKMLYNGKTQIYYLTNEYKQLSYLLPSLDAEGFMAICTNLIANILNVKNNGFLSCQNIDISFDRIYIDQFTYRVQLIYLPIAERLFDDVSSFENVLRTSLIRTIQRRPSLSSPRAEQLVENLSNGTLSLENLYATIIGSKMSHSLSSGQMKLVAMGEPSQIEIVITKDDFTIGKKADIVDGVVPFNKMISRSHCKITRNGLQYMVTDLKSVNGTYINGVRLQPNRPYPIKSGDVLGLANSNFQVVEK
ncbi:MAG: FHA domain-containing protein [Oscillospiraceae bacterium]|nr:FHA domain-containing protein [Oscillospiraceae bacterium]